VAFISCLVLAITLSAYTDGKIKIQHSPKTPNRNPMYRGGQVSLHPFGMAQMRKPFSGDRKAAPGSDAPKADCDKNGQRGDQHLAAIALDLVCGHVPQVE